MPVPIINPLRLLSELNSSAGTIATIDIAIAFKTLHKNTCCTACVRAISITNRDVHSLYLNIKNS